MPSAGDGPDALSISLCPAWMSIETVPATGVRKRIVQVARKALRERCVLHTTVASRTKLYSPEMPDQGCNHRRQEPG